MVWRPRRSQWHSRYSVVPVDRLDGVQSRGALFKRFQAREIEAVAARLATSSPADSAASAGSRPGRRALSSNVQYQTDNMARDTLSIARQQVGPR